jgi:hypothetical protein
MRKGRAGCDVARVQLSMGGEAGGREGACSVMRRLGDLLTADNVRTEGVSSSEVSDRGGSEGKCITADSFSLSLFLLPLPCFFLCIEREWMQFCTSNKRGSDPL